MADTTEGAGVTGCWGDKEGSGGIWPGRPAAGVAILCRKALQGRLIRGRGASGCGSLEGWCLFKGHSRWNIRQSAGHVGLQMKREAEAGEGGLGHLQVKVEVKPGSE